MKTLEILTASEKTLSPKLKQLKIKELEKHAQKILLKLGQSDYDAVMKTVIKRIPSLGNSTEDKFAVVQSLIRDFIAEEKQKEAETSDIIERLSVIVMLLITKKFQKILNEQKSNSN